MATLPEMAEKLRAANPKNSPMTLEWMAEQWWPDATWLKKRVHKHNGGARKGERVAAGQAGRLARLGLLKPYRGPDANQSLWLWVA